MATLKLEKKTAFPFFILHECGDGVRRVAEKVSRDVIGVTDTQTEVSVVEICAKGKKDTQHHSQAVFVATDGCGERAEKLLYEIPELKRVKGKKESYAFLIRENVLEEAENALVIYGSDRLGTIYGLFHLSELLGVTPMLYWGDCPYKKRNPGKKPCFLPGAPLLYYFVLFSTGSYSSSQPSSHASSSKSSSSQSSSSHSS